MFDRACKVGYFSLPQGVSKDFPRTYFLLDEDKKNRIGEISGPKMPYHQFARSLGRGDITLTQEGKNFVEEIGYDSASFADGVIGYYSISSIL